MIKLLSFYLGEPFCNTSRLYFVKYSICLSIHFQYPFKVNWFLPCHELLVPSYVRVIFIYQLLLSIRVSGVHLGLHRIWMDPLAGLTH